MPSSVWYPVVMAWAPRDEGLRLLFQGAHFQTIPKGEVLHSSDRPPRLHLLVGGYVKRYFISHQGNLGIQAIYGPGDIFPLTPVFKTLFEQDIYQGPEVYYYEAMNTVRIIAGDPSVLKERADADPEVYRVLLQSAGNRLHSNIQFLENLRLHGAYCKTAHQIAYLGQRFGEYTAQGIRLPLPLTHQDIADIIGTTRETVTASVIKLRDKRLITTSGRFTILNFDQLIDEAYS